MDPRKIMKCGVRLMENNFNVEKKFVEMIEEMLTEKSGILPDKHLMTDQCQSEDVHWREA